MKTHSTRTLDRPLRCGRLMALACAWAACTVAPAQTAAPAASAAAQRKPAAIVDLRSAIEQTAAVVEGTVTEIHNDYSDSDGPWTRVVLSDVTAHLGSAPAALEIRHFGGRLPSGRQVVAAELPVFMQGKRYIVFLRNTTWNVSPVVGDMALRVEKIGATEVLVNTDGMAVTGVNGMGPQFGEALFEGPKMDGSPSVALSQRMPAMARAPLDRAGFVQALRSQVASRNLVVAGRFNAEPGGAFKWRAIPTAPAADSARAEPGTPDQGSGSDIDTSRPTTPR